MAEREFNEQRSARRNSRSARPDDNAQTEVRARHKLAVVGTLLKDKRRELMSDIDKIDAEWLLGLNGQHRLYGEGQHILGALPQRLTTVPPDMAMVSIIRPFVVATTASRRWFWPMSCACW
jgi:hypothetical protein